MFRPLSWSRCAAAAVAAAGLVGTALAAPAAAVVVELQPVEVAVYVVPEADSAVRPGGQLVLRAADGVDLFGQTLMVDGVEGQVADDGTSATITLPAQGDEHGLVPWELSGFVLPEAWTASDPEGAHRGPLGGFVTLRDDAPEVVEVELLVSASLRLPPLAVGSGEAVTLHLPEEHPVLDALQIEDLWAFEGAQCSLLDSGGCLHHQPVDLVPARDGSALRFRVLPQPDNPMLSASAHGWQVSPLLQHVDLHLPLQRAGFAHATFGDVPMDAWSSDPVEWAVEAGITGGATPHAFAPNATVTRAQAVTFLWRAAGRPAPARPAAFGDVPAGSYYADAVAWAAEEQITGGTTASTFSPQDPVTRAQSVTFLWRFAGNPAAPAASGFADVPAGAYFADAVAWASSEGITGGRTPTAFEPAQPVSRAQQVAFLYRLVWDV